MQRSKSNLSGTPDSCEHEYLSGSYIFERFFLKNSGLGIFLSREILLITGIPLREAGEPGKGARFKMTVPKGNFRTVNNKPVQER